jgi:hypothetical protein
MTAQSVDTLANARFCVFDVWSVNALRAFLIKQANEVWKEKDKSVYRHAHTAHLDASLAIRAPQEMQ